MHRHGLKARKILMNSHGHCSSEIIWDMKYLLVRAIANSKAYEVLRSSAGQARKNEENYNQNDSSTKLSNLDDSPLLGI